MVLGALRAQIQELQVRTPQANTLLTSLAVGMTASKEILYARITNTIVLLKGALVTKNESNRPMVNMLKGVQINMAMLSWEMLYVLQDGVTVEL